jgi:hypothetical protein
MASVSSLSLRSLSSLILFSTSVLSQPLKCQYADSEDDLRGCIFSALSNILKAVAILRNIYLIGIPFTRYDIDFAKTLLIGPKQDEDKPEEEPESETIEIIDEKGEEPEENLDEDLVMEESNEENAQFGFDKEPDIVEKFITEMVGDETANIKELIKDFNEAMTSIEKSKLNITTKRNRINFFATMLS